mgnify:CR=1 FL=1
MKKLHWGASVMALLFCACSQTEIVEIEPQMKGVSFTASDFVIGEVSRTSIEITDQAAVFTWVATDTIGIFPDLPREQYALVKNSSLEGAGIMLLDHDRLTEAKMLAENIHCVQFASVPDFLVRMQAAKFIPHTDMGRFPSVKI